MTPLAVQELRVTPLTAADRVCHPEMTDDEFGEMLTASCAQRYQGRFYEALVIRRGGEIAGRMSLLGGEDGTASEGVEVFAAYRRQGTATIALALLAARASCLGFRALTAQVRTDNAASIALHTRLGFVIDRTHVNRRGREVHEMCLLLPSAAGEQPQHHVMSLRPGPFAAVASGRKRYELRLNDEKRRMLRVGDLITFQCTDGSAEASVCVVSLRPFPDFAALYASLPLTECGYTEENAAVASPDDMEKYYPPQRQAQYGVLAIGITRVR